MNSLSSNKVWKDRLEEIDTNIEQIRIPKLSPKQYNISQDKEWFEVRVGGYLKRIRFHDYRKLYEIPGLYEKLFYEKLKCCSPSVVVNLLEDMASDFGEDTDEFKVLDVGAGNGMVGDELKNIGVDSVMGIDILPEAKKATFRDRPEIYDDYLVTNLADMPKKHEIKLEEEDFNCLITVAALGFGDIPPLAFLRALNFIETPGWLAFNIKENFLHEDDTSGFCQLIRQMNREKLMQIQCYRRYRHRISITGKPLYYVAMIAKKLKDAPNTLLNGWEH
jgi:hypothetical protein